MWDRRSVLCTLIALSAAFALPSLSTSTETLSAPAPGPSNSNDNPVAIAGADMTAAVGEPLPFDGTSSYDPDQTGGWSTAPELPVPIRIIAGTGVLWGESIYVFAGVTNDSGVGPYDDLNTTWRFDLALQTWERMAPFPSTGRFDAAAAVVDEGILFFGGDGKDHGDHTETFLYDPATDSWSSRADTLCKAAATAAVLNGRVYTYADGYQTFCSYDPEADNWSVLAPYQLANPFFWGKEGATLVALDGLIYAIGGLPGVPSVVVYNPANDSWSAGPSMPYATADGSVAKFQGRIHAIGGQIGFLGSDVNEEFDPASGMWAFREPMPTPRDEAAIVAVGDTLHVIGGSQEEVKWQLATHEVYTVSLNYSWDFGDGSNADGKTANHSFRAPGVYTITLTVTDLKGGVGTDTLLVTILSDNEPPVASAGGAYHALEGDSILFDASASSDPDGDSLTYRWDFESDGVFDTADSPDPTATRTWGDDYAGTVTLEVSDGTHQVTATAAVVIGNVAPTLDSLQVYAPADLTLRVAGEKFHDVCLELSHDSAVTGSACVVRTPGSPDRQAATIHGGRIQLLGDTALRLTYTPDDDPVNGQRNGANPAWVILTFADGSEVRLHHTFNVRHPATWTWTLDDLRPLLVGKPITFEVAGTDVGSDDLSFDIDFGDGGVFTATVFNDGVGPDPYPSPEVNPIAATVTAEHAYGAKGTYAITVTARDDDGGTAALATSVTL